VGDLITDQVLKQVQSSSQSYVPTLYNLNDNMVVYQGAKTSSTGLFANLDAAYLFASAYQPPVRQGLMTF